MKCLCCGNEAGNYFINEDERVCESCYDDYYECYGDDDNDCPECNGTGTTIEGRSCDDCQGIGKLWY